jgi:hypothetical protein
VEGGQVSDGGFPAVTPAEAYDDRCWFSAHLQRHYRYRPGPASQVWVVRRRGRRNAAYLRTLAPAFAYLDSDAALRLVWFRSVWPNLDPVEREELVKEAREAKRSKTGRRRSG